MHHLIDLMNVTAGPLALHGMPDPAEADQQQQRENEDCRHPPTRPRRNANAKREEGKHEVPAPCPAEAGAEQHLAYRIGIERRSGRAGHIRGDPEHQAQRRKQHDGHTDDRHAPKPGIEGGESVGRSRRIAAEPVKPESAAAEDHDCGRELQ